MDEVSTFLTEIKSDSAKHRERVVKGLSPAAMQNADVIAALQQIVSTDPASYVRDAAGAQLVANGQTPMQSAASVTLKQEGTSKPVIFALTCIGIPVLLFVCAIVVIAILAILGPQIGNIFSRVTNGLSTP